MWWTGAHISVYADPEKHEVTLTDIALSWRRPKNRRVCVIRLSKEMRPQVEKWLSLKRRYTRQRYFQMLKAIGERAGIKDLSPMTLRHSFAFHQLEKRHWERIYEVAMMMGCKESTLLEHYATLRKD